MFAQLFGNYLESKEIITTDMKLDLQEMLSASRTRLGVLAVVQGLLTPEQADEINHVQVTENKRFGDIAIEKGYLTPSDIDDLISLQGNEYDKYIQLLNDTLDFDLSTISSYLSGFQSENGFSDEDFKALKNDDFKALIDLYCPISDKTIKKLVEIIVNNITRFVSTDFYFEALQKKESFEYAVTVGIQGLKEEKNDLYLGFSAINNTRGITSLASDYAITIELLNSGDVYDAIGEFANMNMGLLSSEVSNTLSINLLPPKAYVGQKTSGSCYVLPIYLHNALFHVIISVDEDFKLGDTEYAITSNTSEINDVITNNKRVVIADDSILIRKILKNILNSADYTVVGEATNGEEAIALYKQLKPDILTLDITMPVMNGLEALRGILDYDKDAKVVMVSAAGQQHNIIEALKLGATLFITKPFDNDDVIDSFNKL